jgi:hypothetical protein
MASLPARFAAIIQAFAPLFPYLGLASHRGAADTGDPRTRQAHRDQPITDHGAQPEPGFVNYHRALSRARWSERCAARLLLRCCWRLSCEPVRSFSVLTTRPSAGVASPSKPRGVYRDPVRSSDAHFVKAQRIAWLSRWCWRRSAGPNLGAALPNDAGVAGTLRV